MFEKFRAKRAAAKIVRDQKAAEARAAKAELDRAGRIKPAQDDYDVAETRLEAVDAFFGLTGSDLPDDMGVILKQGESLYCLVTGAVLIEPKKGPGQWKGRSQGVSMPIPGTRLRYRIGASKGSFEQGEETPTPIDEGTFVVTDKRGIFTGQKQSREWAWSKLLGVTHYEPGWTAIAVSNRQKISGVGVDSANVEHMRFLVELAVARATGSSIDDLRSDAQADVAEARAALTALGAPVIAPPPAAAVLPPTNNQPT
jgi:hypothetical protein